MRRPLEGSEFEWVEVGVRVCDEVVLELRLAKVGVKLKVTWWLAGICAATRGGSLSIIAAAA